MNLLKIENETICPIVLYGVNRSGKVTQYHKKVMVDYFSLPINYIECPFPQVSHGWCMNQIINRTIDTLPFDYYWFLDNDAIILKKECIDLFYSLVKNKQGIASHIQNSNHKKIKGQNHTIHPYCSQAFLWFSKQIYNELDRPCMDHWSDGSDDSGGDTAERLTIECKKRGKIVSILYPSHVIYPHSPIDAGLLFGRGNTFGNNLLYHQMRSDMPESENEFIQKCEEVLDGKYQN